MSVAPEATRLIRELEDALTKAAASIHTLQVEYNVTINFSIGIGPDGKRCLQQFQALAPLDLRKMSS